MAAALNDVIRVTVNQKQNGQTVQNVFFYQVVTLTGLTGAYLEIVRDWFLDEVLPPIRNAQTAAITYESMNIQNVTNGIDFLDHPFTAVQGLNPSANTLPPNVTMTFRLIRETLATRHGYKRFAGIPEEFQQNGVYVAGASILTDIQEALAADIQPAPAVVPLFAPVIVRKATDGSILAVNNIGSSDFRGIGTQNTRKIGRGS